jgi:hypothetical protein
MSNYLNTMQQPPCSMAHLRARTEEEGECWNWRAAYRSKRWPTIAFRRDWGSGAPSNKVFYVRHIAYFHKYGKAPDLGLFRALVPSCGNHQCINPDHLKIVSRKTVVRMMVAAGHMSKVGRRQKVAQARRLVSKLSDEAVVEIRQSEDVARVVAEKHGISAAYVYMIRRGECRKDYSNPFAGLAG